MSRDSGSEPERAQRTVAELLAEYGGAGAEAPRRRRRRAEDDEHSAPQTIIERVLSDSGKLLPIRDEDQPPQPPRGARRGGDHRPGAPQPAPPRQPQQPQPGPQLPPTQYAEPVRPPTGPPSRPQMPAPQMPPAQQMPPPMQSGPMQSGPMPQPQLQPPPQQVRPAMPPTSPPAMPPTSQPTQAPPQQLASRPGMPPVGQPSAAMRVPPAPAGPQVSRPAMTPVGPPTQQPISRPNINPPPRTPPPMAQRPPAGPMDDNIATAVHPPLPPDPGPPPQAVQSRLAGMPPAVETTEEFPRTLAPNQGPTQVVPAVGQPRRAPEPALDATQAHPGPYVDDFEDSRPQERLFDDDQDFNPSRREDFDGPDDFDDRDRPRPGRDRIDAMDDDDDLGSLSPGREWLLMGAQVGAGAIAGAAVFLAFSWLWGFQPIVAVLAALVVIVGLVFGVRRWRRADDLQTTVLAILAGLVVTVSPAALLLVRR